MKSIQAGWKERGAHGESFPAEFTWDTACGIANDFTLAFRKLQEEESNLIPADA